MDVIEDFQTYVSIGSCLHMLVSFYFY